MEAGPTAVPNPDSVLSEDFLTPGEKFGDFQVMQCLSFGLTGGFYRMQHIREFHEVAALVVPKRASQTPGFEERFEAMAARLQKFEHPNAIKVIGAGRIKERHCLFTELVEGVNVNDYMEEYTRQTLIQAGALEAPTVDPVAAALAEPGPAEVVVESEALKDKQFGLPPPVVKSILSQATDAVRAAHEEGIHHFGLNPTSMILTPEGQTKVFGFGLMEMLGKDLFEQVVSQGIPPILLGGRRVVINTVDTLSPEVRAGEAPDSRSDLYALGLCGYFLLTGHKPVAPVRPPSEFSAAIPDGWDRVVLRCLEVDPARRPASAAQLRGEIERLGAQAADPNEASLDRLLKKVPIPGSLQRRLSSARLRLVRLCVLGAFSLAVMAAAVLSILELFSTDTGPRAAVVVKTPAGRTPQLQLRIRPERAKVTFRTGDSLTTIDGQLDLTLPTGEHEFTVEAPNHKPARLSTRVTREPQTMNVALEALWAWLEVKAPPGTRILAIPERGPTQEAGVVPESGLLAARRSVFIGTYTIRAERENYVPVERKNVKLELGKAVNLAFQLEPLPAKVRVETDPPGATVFLNRREVGRTPVEVGDLPVQRDLRLDVLLDHHRPHTQVLHLEPGEQRVIDLGQMARKTGSVVVEVAYEGLGGATAAALRRATTIRIGGREAAASAGTVDLVDEGEQVLEVEHPDYQTHREIIEVIDQETIRKLVTLTPRPAELRVEVAPGVPYTLVAAGREIPLVDGVHAVPPGMDVPLEVRAPDYLVARRTLTLRPNDRQTWTLTLAPIPAPEAGSPWIVPYVGTRMVAIPAGQFTYGSPPLEAERLPEEGPETTARLSRPFWIGAYEVTQAEFEAVMNRNPSRFQGANRPVENVTWSDAMAFAERITERERRAGRLPAGYVYRLPTEAEWEYAARAGTRTPFAWGDTADNTMGNFKGRYPREFGSGSTTGDARYGTVPVGQFAPNAWGLYDVHGNVREWTWDRFNARLPGGTATDYAGPPDGEARSVRGGGWEDFAHRCRAAARERRLPANAGPSVGFRLVLAPAIP